MVLSNTALSPVTQHKQDKLTAQSTVTGNAGDTVQVTTYLQDPWVDKAVIREVPRQVVGSGLANDRVKITDLRPKAQPDQAGNYLMQSGSNGDSQVNAQVFTTNTLNMWQRYRGSQIEWSFGDQVLDVVPHKKQGMNAYYSRWEGSTNFFFQDSPQLNTTVKTANSLDIVAHETGHGILDAMKPGYLNTNDRETGAFHEAFGDCSAMLASLQDAGMCEKIIQQTGGDLSKPNAIAWLAEEFGKARRLANDDPSDDDRAWLRNAQNSFTYVKPESLGDGRGDDEHLGGEIHSFARLWAGAFYDCLKATYDDGISQDLPPATALKFAADKLGPLLARAVDMSPSSRVRYKDVALQLLRADQETNQGHLSPAFKKIFMDRKILTTSDVQAEAQRLSRLPDLSVDHDFVSKAEVAAFVSARAAQLGLAEGLDLTTSSMSLKPDGEQVVNLAYKQNVAVTVAGLEGLTTDIEGGLTLAFDAQGKLIEFHHSAITPAAIEDEMQGIAYQQRQQQIIDEDRQGLQFTRSDGQTYLSVIRDGKLVRIPSSACNCGACTQCK